MKIMLLAAASMLTVSTSVIASTVSVATDPSAPTSNFGSPGNTATAGYDLTLGDNGSSVIGLINQTGGTSAGAFANLYFDLNPTVMDGSDLGFELGGGSLTAFIPGKNGQAGFSTVIDPGLYSFSAVTVAGLTALNFSLANSLFTSPIAGLSYYSGQTFESVVTLRLSQSLSYSVAGGASYGPDRLGSVTVGSAGAVPEPVTWGMMVVGFGVVGLGMRRRSLGRAQAA
jgi:hypothetical protein